MKKSFIDLFFLKLIVLYRAGVSPWLPRSCRFEPSCSKYAQLCIEKHGFLGSWLFIVRRVLGCNPLNKKTGYDPAP